MRLTLSLGFLISCCSFDCATGQNAEAVVASAGGVDVLFIPDDEMLLDGDLMGGTLRLRSDEGTRMVTFGRLSLETLHHVGAQTPFGISPTLSFSDHIDAVHALYDSHLLFTDMIAGSVGEALRETGFDDPSAADPAGVQDRIPPDSFGNSASTYLGDIFNLNGAFFLGPDSQSNAIDFARLVGRPGNVSNVQFLVLGDGFDGATFDFDLAWGTPAGTPPTIQLDPLPEIVQFGNPVTLSATASDSDGQVSLVQFYADDKPIPGCRLTSAPYECDWSLNTGSGIPQITRSVRARVRDDAGMSTYSDAAQIVFENPLPAVHLRASDLGNSWSLTATASDPDGIALVEFFANDELIPGCSLTTTPYVCSWMPDEGAYAVRAHAVDTVGFAADSRELEIVVDYQPEIRVTNPAVDLTGTRAIRVGETLTLTAEAERASLVEFLANDELIPGCSFSTGPFQCDWSPEAGEYTLEAHATDDQRNTASDARQVSVLADIDYPPGVTLTSPITDRVLWAGESLAFSATAHDPEGELVSVELLADGDPIPNCSFTTGPFECEWTPEEGEHLVWARAVDNGGNTSDSTTRLVSVFPPASGGIDELPVDEDGNPIIDAEFLGWYAGVIGSRGLIEGVPAPVTFVEVPVAAEGGPVLLIDIVEIADEADVFSYIGDPPPIRFETRPFIAIGPFDLDTTLAGTFLTTYELTFHDGSQVLATLSATVEPIPEPSGGFVLMTCLLAMTVVRRRGRS